MQCRYRIGGISLADAAKIDLRTVFEPRLIAAQQFDIAPADRNKRFVECLGIWYCGMVGADAPEVRERGCGRIECTVCQFGIFYGILKRRICIRVERDSFAVCSVELAMELAET